MSKKRNEDEDFYLHDNYFGGESQSDYSNSLDMEMPKKEELKREEKKDIKHQIQLVQDFEIIRQKKKRGDTLITKRKSLLNINNNNNQFVFENENDYVNAINDLKIKLENDKKNHELEINKVNNEISEKEELIKSISNINLIMEKNLKKLTSKVEKLNDNENFIKKEKEEPIKIALKVKEKDIKNVQSIVNLLSKENKNMQNILDNYTDYDNKRELSDRLILKEKENNILKNEIKTLKIFNKDYDYWEKEKEDLNLAIQELENKLQLSQRENREGKKEIKLLENKYYNNSRNISQKIKDKLKQKEETSEDYAKSFDYYNLKKQEKKKLLEIKSTKYIANSIYNLLSNEQKEQIKNLYGDENKDKYDILIKKIEDLEKYRISNNINDLNIIKNQNNEINDLDEQLNYLEKLSNDKSSNIKTLETQINEYKNYKKTLQKKINSLIKVYDDLKEKKKNKEKENKNLLNQCTELQNLIKENCNGLIEDEEISKITNSIKKEKNISKTPNYNKSKKIIK